jgi:hypothetical protein
MDIGRHPFWHMPDEPDYRAFREHFAESKDFPSVPENCDIRVTYEPAAVGMLALAYCWPIAILFGLLYRAIRGSKRDMILHCALHLALGLLAGVGLCIVVWLVLGGWGPPALELFVALGVIGGIASGVVSFNKGKPGHSTEAASS